jgi:hypothetical protein
VLVLVATRSIGDFVEQTGRTPTRTSTRPPHPLHPTPCPYRTLGRKHLNGYEYPIRSSKINWADMMMDYGINYLGVTPAQMIPDSLREILFDLFPQKVSAAKRTVEKSSLCAQFYNCHSVSALLR